jgi:hypothetical protein
MISSIVSWCPAGWGPIAHRHLRICLAGRGGVIGMWLFGERVTFSDVVGIVLMPSVAGMVLRR